MKATYLVTLTIPPNVTKMRLKAYVEDAVASMCGGYHPDDPLFKLDGDSVRVKSVRKPKKGNEKL